MRKCSAKNVKKAKKSVKLILVPGFTHTCLLPKHLNKSIRLLKKNNAG